jgi:U3 small nucleolar ribonucleoprotein protein IMP4
MVILHETRGEPDGLIICHLPYGPTAYFGLSNVVLRHDLKEKIDHVSEAYPHLIFDGFETRLGDRISDILKYVFPLPKVDSKRTMTFQNDNDFISFRHHVYKKEDHKDVTLKELGPRFEMKPY